MLHGERFFALTHFQLVTGHMPHAYANDRKGVLAFWILDCLLRACLHDSGMTFIPERVHSIPIHFSVSVYMIRRRKSSHSGMSSFRFSFRNESFVLGWHFILVSCKHRMNFVPRWTRNLLNRIRTPQFEFRAKKRNSIYSLAQRSSSMVKLLVKTADTVINGPKTCSRETLRHLVLISRGNRARENAFGWTDRLCHVNAERISFLYEFRSGMKVIPESCKQALIVKSICHNFFQEAGTF